ncbi:hypothetical protein ABPG75_009463 [Micractinium tetrahymenae]
MNTAPLATARPASAPLAPRPASAGQKPHGLKHASQLHAPAANHIVTAPKASPLAAAALAAPLAAAAEPAASPAPALAPTPAVHAPKAPPAPRDIMGAAERVCKRWRRLALSGLPCALELQWGRPFPSERLTLNRRSVDALLECLSGRTLGSVELRWHGDKSEEGLMQELLRALLPPLAGRLSFSYTGCALLIWQP